MSSSTVLTKKDENQNKSAHTDTCSFMKWVYSVLWANNVWILLYEVLGNETISCTSVGFVVFLILYFHSLTASIVFWKLVIFQIGNEQHASSWHESNRMKNCLSLSHFHSLPYISFLEKKGPTVAQWKETLTGLCCEYTVTVCFSVCLIIFYKAHASVCISPTLGTTNLPPCKKCFSSNLFILRRVEQRYQPG